MPPIRKSFSIGRALSVILRASRLVGLFIRVGFERRHDPQGKEDEQGDRDGDGIARKTRRDADCTGCPKAGGRGRTLDGIALLQDRATAKKADTADHALQNARDRGRIVRHHGLDGLNKAAAGDRHQRKGSKPRAPLFPFPVPPDGDRQEIGDREGCYMRQKGRAVICGRKAELSGMDGITRRLAIRCAKCRLEQQGASVRPIGDPKDEEDQWKKSAQANTLMRN
jgi:hypothetical protein